MSDARPRYFFLHLQKTAGTTLYMRIRRNLPERAIYPDKCDGDLFVRVISVEHLLDRWAARSEEIEVVAGHFPLCTTDLLDAEFTTFTVLRHPLDRTISYLRHHREMIPDDADLTLEQVYDDDSRFNGLIHNHMTKMLSLLPDEMDDGALTRVDFTRSRLEFAKERLASIDAVGLQEDFESFWDEISERFGWRRPINRNRTNQRSPAELAQGFRDRILEDNAHDLELYEFARRLVRERALRAT